MKYIVSAALSAALLAPMYGVGAAAPSNLALNKPALASSIERESRAAEFAVDANGGTRWSSDFSDGNWISVDLESVYDISSVVLHWETAYAEKYNLQFSVDGESWQTVRAVTDGTGGVDSFALSEQARYVRVESVKRATSWGVSLWKLEVYGTEPEPARNESENLALGKALFASSSERANKSPEQAADGDMTSRWSSQFADGEWIAVDLGATYAVSSLILNWETAYAQAYDIQVSNDANAWQTVRSITDSDGGQDIIDVSATGRYIRVLGVQRATRWGISLWELEIYGDEPVVIPDAELVSEGRPATASSTERATHSAENAFDGHAGTRWASAFTDYAWLQVDLGVAHQISEVILEWEVAHSSEYQVQTSYDGESWTTVEHVLDGSGGTVALPVSGHGRYVRLAASKRATSWGHSLWQMQVMGYPAETAEPPTEADNDAGSNNDDGSSGNEGGDDGSASPVDSTAPAVPSSLNASVVGPTHVALSWFASSDDEAVSGYEVYRNGIRIAEVVAPRTDYMDIGLSVGTAYQYSVRAGDAAGNWSGLSSTLVVATQSEPVVSDGLVLAWTTPSQRENGNYLELGEIGGYEIRYQTIGGGTRQSIIVEDAYATSYELDLDEGEYQFSIAVYDVNGLYSQFVNLVPMPQ